MSDNVNGPSAVKSKQDLPPSRERKGMRPVSPPLSNVSMHRFNYYMAVVATLILAFYAWRLTVWKAEAGGWWNLMLGKQPPAFRDGQDASGSGVNKAYTGSGTSYQAASTGESRVDLTVEERISELASALGMPSKDLASAIAVAVHEYVPPATLSSIAAHQSGCVTYAVCLRVCADFFACCADLPSSSLLTRLAPQRPRHLPPLLHLRLQKVSMPLRKLSKLL